MSVEVRDSGEGLDYGPPEPLFEHEGSRSWRSVDVTASGDRFLVVTPNRDPDPRSAHLILNWPELVTP